uniref:diguanylate cyclase n=1 Tax=Magnetococcus massalia (strain MO-1) TaxID=451514 RepID=A0A1S7LK92_MAGMO|nr:Protein of unknown function. Probable diguanylate cyclase [Candidatus Magnetococcus massalia]
MIFKRKKKPSDDRSAGDLKVTLAFIDGEHDNRDEARAILKDAIFQQAMGPDPQQDPTTRLLVHLLVNDFKPALHGDLEGQQLTERLITRIKKGAHLEQVDEVQESFKHLVQHLASYRPGQSRLRSQTANHPLTKSLPTVMDALTTLTQGEAWAEPTGNQLKAQSSAPPHDYWQRLEAFCQQAASQGASSFERWESSRKLLLDLVAEMAQRIQIIRTQTSGATGRLDASMGRIQAATDLDELEAVRTVLINEAEALRKQTEELEETLQDQQEELERTKLQLHQAQQALDEAREESLTDPLTHIANRRALFESLSKEFSRSRRYKEPLSLLILDLDHFKKINDNFGHPVGDKVLIQVASHVKELLRKADTVGRYGGEEFVVLLPETGLQQAEEKAEQIRHQINALKFKLRDETLQVTASIGVAQLDDGEAADPNEETLIKRADKALYTAKDSGRNRVELAPPSDGIDRAVTS